ncbi:hypothetical protein [Aporhodopirellula aestuarii]|uniref:Uncharacterized protein n=1 Tax=Aporhodopirellula aestuarii TaxID=2950107 RepID=A0ABT0U8G3_9BACT|nr:hypothetical protein [Aporhodopirellula aestuarii]MCM2373257.1 hypothetical protein [Aporhodopirellula aestuarii]
MSISSNSTPPSGGNDCFQEAIVSLDWQSLSIRFDDEVFASDFGGWIEKDLLAMEDRLSHFATKSSTQRRSR